MQSSLFALLGVFVGAFISNRLIIAREERQRRTDFIAKLTELKTRGEKTLDESFSDWFGNSQVAVARECAIVEAAIEWHRRKKFNALRENYVNAKRSDIEDFDNAKMDFPRTMTYQLGRNLVSEAMQGLTDCAK